MRLGYFGGSFDPPHLGHLAVARAAAETYALDKVLLVPTANQPLKPGGARAPYADRLAMVKLLCAGDARLEASEIEAPTIPPTPNYTIDTLQRLQAEQPAAELFVIVGVDAFHQLPQWRSPEKLLAIAEWIVVTRPHVPAEERRLPELSPEELKHVHRLKELDHPASATNIRAELAKGADCEGLLSPQLLAYIREHDLYR
jgi:nicotinate-nucleotide adenylyltransferase